MQLGLGMRAFRAFVQEHAIASYFVLTFAISWGGIGMVIATAHTGLVASQEEFARLVPVWSPLLVLGPAVAGILLTSVVGGRSGLREYRRRLFRLVVGARWYAAALLTGPVCYLAVSFALAALSRDFLPAIVTTDDKAGLVATGAPVALLAGIFEELGWTGFAVPALLKRHTAMRTGLIVGLLWGAWHFMPKLFGAAVGSAGAFWPIDMLCAVVGLTGFRILMVWVYERTRSLPLAMIMHAAITGSMMIIQPAVTGTQFIAAVLALAAAPWLLIAAVGLVSRAGSDAALLRAR